MALLTACTKAELCEHTELSHRAGVRFDYDWSLVNSDSRVNFHGAMPNKRDTVMLTIIKRIIGTEITACCYNVLQNKGYSLTDDTPESIPLDVTASITDREDGDANTAGNTDNTDNSDNKNDTPTNKEHFNIDLFKVRPGTFKLITVNRDTTEFDYTELYNYIETGWAETPLHELCVEYKRYKYGSKKLRDQIPGWSDYNVYGNPDENGIPAADNYLQPDMAPVYYDSIAPCEVSKNSEHLFTFKPILLTQNVDIRFHIRKKVDVSPFSIEAVYADISGIPYRLNLSTGLFDILNTAKMMFTCKLENANGEEIADEDNNTYLLCHGNIDVLSLVNAPNDETVRGPGILQLMVKIKDRPKAVRARVNLFHAIERANLYRPIDDGEWAVRRKAYGTLEIDTGLVIDEAATVTQDEEGGLDVWVEVGKDEIIVDA